MRIQVKKSHYLFPQYVTQKRWNSMWHQLQEVLALAPENVLEIGPGTGIFSAVAKKLGVTVKTIDIDPNLQPDHVGAAHDIPLESSSFDVVCAFQVLEHMPFDMSIKSILEMCRVARKAVIISLPDARTTWPFTLTLPKIGAIRFSIPRPFFTPIPHVFDGQHYWEINKSGYELKSVVSAMSNTTPSFDIRTYRVHDNPYHRFFVLTPKGGHG